MRKELVWFFIVLSILLFPGIVKGQGLSTLGTDFWLGFMDNYGNWEDNPIILEIYISCEDTVSGNIEMPANASFGTINFTITPPNGVLIITIPTIIGMTDAYDEIQDKGIHITTDKNVSVYAMNKRQWSADITVVLPTYSLGSEYFVTSHWQDRNRNDDTHSESEFLIVGVEDNTEIEIIPSVNTRSGKPAGVPYTINLDKGQVYQVWAYDDLTGSKVTAIDGGEGLCRQFALFAGNRYTKVGACYESQNGHDHLYAQMYPVATWGKEYIVVDFKDRLYGDLVKILAAHDNTLVYIDTISYTLNSGEYLSLILDGVHNITSNKPVSVGHFSRSQTCDNTRGDPFLIMISPNEQLMKRITFYSPTVATITRYDVNVIAKTSDTQTVKLDGGNIGNSFQQVPDNPEFSYARVTISQGVHSLTSQEGFIAYVYGFGANESFGYVTGASLENLVLNFNTKTLDGENIPIDSICWNTEILFYPEFEGQFSRFVWNFGDGTTHETDKPDSIPHIYPKPGKYLVELYASIGETGCAAGANEVSRKFIHVVKPASKIFGPRSVCPFTDSVAYFSTEKQLYSYSWFEEGGEIVNIQSDSILINWGETNRDAGVELLVEDHLGCVGDTIRKPVRINIQLDPEAPLGPDTLCSSNINDVVYRAYFTQFSKYEWHTDFATINEGQDSEEILLDWDSYGSGILWFEQSSTQDTICSGTSDTLIVYIQRDPSEIAEILSEKDSYQIGEIVNLSVIADTLYQVTNWEFGNANRIDTIDRMYQPETYYNCPGEYVLTAVVFDTLEICETKAYAEKPISILSPELEIINVTNLPEMEDVLEINWKTRNTDFYIRKIELVKDGEDLVASFFKNIVHFVDTVADPDAEIYLYQLNTNFECPEIISSFDHNNINLDVEIREEESSVTDLVWNDYINWNNGIKYYEIWLSVDDKPDSLLSTFPGTSYAFEENSLGFEHCFRIRAIEEGGNESMSWSNEACVTYIPEIYAYNVITPNNDNANETFIIENIEHYPNSVLTIYNRWGKILYESVGYENNWSGMASGELLPSSVYFYILELNEPRSKVERNNGTISILY
ncbi:gliding motility-associated C-terminal domain-containing protein [Bacteroidota bacterium]